MISEQDRDPWAVGGEYRMKAHLDGTEWHLFIENENGDMMDLPWPEEWGEYMTEEQVKAAGYQIV